MEKVFFVLGVVACSAGALTALLARACSRLFSIKIKREESWAVVVSILTTIVFRLVGGNNIEMVFLIFFGCLSFVGSSVSLLITKK